MSPKNKFRCFFPYILLLLDRGMSFVIPRTSLYRGSLNRSYTVIIIHTCFAYCDSLMAKLENKRKFTLSKFGKLDPKQDFGFFEVFEPGHVVYTYFAPRVLSVDKFIEVLIKPNSLQCDCHYS